MATPEGRLRDLHIAHARHGLQLLDNVMAEDVVVNAALDDLRARPVHHDTIRREVEILAHAVGKQVMMSARTKPRSVRVTTHSCSTHTYSTFLHTYTYTNATHAAQHIHTHACELFFGGGGTCSLAD